MIVKLTTQSITKLIRVCRENGVSEIKTDDIHLLLGFPAIETPRVPHRAAIPNPAAILDENSQVLTEEQYRPKAEAQPEDTFLLEQVVQADADQAEMLLDDPFEFESRLASGELTDDGDKITED